MNRQRFLALLLLIALGLSVSAQENIKVKVVKKGVILSGEYGDLECPKNTVFTVLKEEENRYQVKGVLFGAKIKGYISKKGVRLLNSNSDHKPAKKTSKKVIKTPPVAIPPKDSKVKYLGRLRSVEFMDALYEKTVPCNYYKNVDSKERCLKRDIPVVRSSAECKKLQNGDVVIIDAMIAGGSRKFSLIRLYNDIYTKRNVNTIIFGESFLAYKTSGERTFSGKAIFRPEKPKDDIPWKINYTFDKAEEDMVTISKEQFYEEVAKGKKFQILCNKCNGTGKRMTPTKPQREVKCSTCRGTGVLSPESSVQQIQFELRYRK
jgi:hypothetical protein